MRCWSIKEPLPYQLQIACFTLALFGQHWCNRIFKVMEEIIFILEDFLAKIFRKFKLSSLSKRHLSFNWFWLDFHKFINFQILRDFLFIHSLKSLMSLGFLIHYRPNTMFHACTTFWTRSYAQLIRNQSNRRETIRFQLAKQSEWVSGIFDGYCRTKRRNIEGIFISESDWNELKISFQAFIFHLHNLSQLFIVGSLSIAGEMIKKRLNLLTGLLSLHLRPRSSLTSTSSRACARKWRWFCLCKWGNDNLPWQWNLQRIAVIHCYDFIAFHICDDLMTSAELKKRTDQPQKGICSDITGTGDAKTNGLCWFNLKLPKLRDHPSSVGHSFLTIALSNSHFIAYWVPRKKPLTMSRPVI